MVQFIAVDPEQFAEERYDQLESTSPPRCFSMLLQTGRGPSCLSSVPVRATMPSVLISATSAESYFCLPTLQGGTGQLIGRLEKDEIDVAMYVLTSYSSLSTDS